VSDLAQRRPPPPTAEDYRRADLVPPTELELLGLPEELGLVPSAEEAMAEAVVESHRGSIGGNLTALLGSQVLTWTIALVVATIQPRLLGPEGVGQLRLAWSIWLMAGIVIAFGGANVITIDTAKGKKSLGVLGRMVALQSVLYVASVPVVVVIVLFGGYSAQSALIIALIGLTVPFTLLSGDARAVLFGLERMSGPATIDVVGRFLGAVVVIATLVATDAVVWVAVAYIANAAVHAVLMVRMLHRGTRFRLRPEYRGLRAVAGMGSAFVIISASLVIYQQIDTVVLSMLMDPAQLGWYSAADGLFGTLLFLPTIVTSVLLPVMARLDAEDRSKLIPLVRRGLRAVILVAVPAGLGTAAVATQVCLLLFGDDFEPSGQVLAVYGLVLVITAPSIVLGQYAAAIGRQKWWAVVMVAAIALTIPLDLVLIPWSNAMFDNGAVGGALSYLVTEAFIFTCAVRKITPGVVDASVIRRSLACLAVGAVMLVVVWPLRDTFFLVPAAVGAVVYIGGILLGKVLDADERAALSGLGRRVRHLVPF
jgi:O-antigen/teichoic acid export membrane protein